MAAESSLADLKGQWDESLYIWSKFKSSEDLSQKWKLAKSRPSALFPGRFRVQKSVKLKRVTGQRWFEYDGKKMVWADKLYDVKAPSIAKRIAESADTLLLGRAFAEDYLKEAVYIVGQPGARKEKIEEWIEECVKKDMEEHEKLVKIHADNKLRLEAALVEAEAFEAGTSERERLRKVALEEARAKILEDRSINRQAEIDALPPNQRAAAIVKQQIEQARARKIAAQEAERLAMLGVRAMRAAEKEKAKKEIEALRKKKTAFIEGRASPFVDRGLALVKLVNEFQALVFQQEGLVDPDPILGVAFSTIDFVQEALNTTKERLLLTRDGSTAQRNAAAASRSGTAIVPASAAAAAASAAAAAAVSGEAPSATVAVAGPSTPSRPTPPPPAGAPIGETLLLSRDEHCRQDGAAMAFSLSSDLIKEAILEFVVTQRRGKKFRDDLVAAGKRAGVENTLLQSAVGPLTAYMMGSVNRPPPMGSRKNRVRPPGYYNNKGKPKTPQQQPQAIARRNVHPIPVQQQQQQHQHQQQQQQQQQQQHHHRGVVPPMVGMGMPGMPLLQGMGMMPGMQMGVGPMGGVGVGVGGKRRRPDDQDSSSEDELSSDDDDDDQHVHLGKRNHNQHNINNHV